MTLDCCGNFSSHGLSDDTSQVSSEPRQESDRQLSGDETGAVEEVMRDLLMDWRSEGERSVSERSYFYVG